MISFPLTTRLLPFICFIFIFVAIIGISSCNKSKPVRISGQLLLSKKYPEPLKNRKIEIYQKGSPSAIGINSGSSSASASGNTDAFGKFSVVFTAGRSEFIIFSGPNKTPLRLHSPYDDTSFPAFTRIDFPEAGYDETKPIYIGKSIDMVILSVQLSKDLTHTDTLGMRMYTHDGSIAKEYTNLSGTAGTRLVLDTIHDALFTGYDCTTGKFANGVYAGKKWTTQFGYSTIDDGWASPLYFSTEDEAMAEVVFYF